MPQVLTTNGLILCPHGGKGITTPMHPKWQINGGTVAVEGDTGILLCPFIPCQCVGYQLKSMGLNATQIDGEKVILVTDFNQTVTGLPLVMADFHQTFDQSTPAPVPPGQTAPPPGAAMADFLSPVVTPTVQILPPFVYSSTPGPVIVNFTMTTDHPLRWILTLINESTHKGTDLTNGAPGATVQPSGGQWTTPIQTIEVTMQAPFIKALGPAPTRHHLFLTGVSQRGFSGHAEAIIDVQPP
jgi:hypothetical protein